MDFSKINLSDNQDLAREIILEASLGNLKNRNDFEKLRNKIVKKRKGQIFHNLYFIKAYNDLVQEGRIRKNNSLLKLIQKRSVRTLSGVAPVTVLTKPYPCPGRCIYCPTDVRMPKSYIPSQPAAQRAFRQRFDPYTQVFVRLKALLITGHEVSKVELRVIGGSWSAYPKRYQKWFLKRCLLAMNEFNEQVDRGLTDDMNRVTKRKKISSIYGEDVVNTVEIKSISRNCKWMDIVKSNEKGKVRCIGINIETRPDLIDIAEVKRLRELGVTKVEMGVQTLDDEVNKITQRGHNVSDVIKATRLLKNAGFKIGYHIMPNLPGSNPKIDIRVIKDIFEMEEFQPDYLKIYPCVVMPNTKLSTMFKNGEHKVYDEKTLEDILYQQIKAVPYWCRIDRIARDIPSNEIEKGFKVSNIRQILEKRFQKNNIQPKEIRFREIRDEDMDNKNVEFVIRRYKASGGEEIFLSFEDVEKDKIIALLRLRFPSETFIPEIQRSALVREVHVYGKQVKVGESDNSEKQHMGWGTKLMNEAEKLAKNNGYDHIAVISGVGSREYYRKKAYKLSGNYMIKQI